MAIAKQPGGFYRTAQGVAVDANGDAIKGAPKQAADTEPSQQPGALGATTPEERIGLAVARAVLDPKGTVAAAAPKPKAEAKTGESEGEDEQELPTISKLADHLAGLTTAKEVKALRKRDDRVGAQPLYEARLAEIEAA